MLEITLCTHNKIKTQCVSCTVGANSGQRACADCEGYFALGMMREKPDGRVICKPCDRKARNLGARKSQLEMFGQENLF